MFGSRQKRETNTNMPGSTDEDDGIDFDEPKDDGIVIMVSKRTNYLLKSDLG